MSDQSNQPEMTAEEERAAVGSIVARIADLPNALGVAAKLNANVIDDGAALDMRTLHLVRVAAMAASGMPQTGWEVNLELMEGDVSVDEIDAVLAVIAPIIGTARYLEAVSVLTGD
ncbi:MAG TPA: hypothetical protein PLS63_13740 [Microthrixaceae bacterium]|mgnify:CR=1 FL=1|nr:hypothetical protein [Microthrixaceae bacterium]